MTKPRIRTCAAICAAAVVAGVGGALAFIYSGVFDFRATVPHNPLVGWALHQTYENSLDRRTEDLPIPAKLESEANIQAGARFYAAHCTACHGEPGKPLDPIGRGIYPQAPTLLKASRNNHPNEVFYVAKYGVKMTAMPAFGNSFADKDLWTVAAFLHAERGIEPGDFTALVAAPAVAPAAK